MSSDPKNLKARIEELIGATDVLATIHTVAGGEFRLATHVEVGDDYLTVPRGPNEVIIPLSAITQIVVQPVAALDILEEEAIEIATHPDS